MTFERHDLSFLKPGHITGGSKPGGAGRGAGRARTPADRSASKQPSLLPPRESKTTVLVGNLEISSPKDLLASKSQSGSLNCGLIRNSVSVRNGTVGSRRGKRVASRRGKRWIPHAIERPSIEASRPCKRWVLAQRPAGCSGAFYRAEIAERLQLKGPCSKRRAGLGRRRRAANQIN